MDKRQKQQNENSSDDNKYKTWFWCLLVKKAWTRFIGKCFLNRSFLKVAMKTFIYGHDKRIKNKIFYHPKEDNLFQEILRSLEELKSVYSL